MKRTEGTIVDRLALHVETRGEDVALICGDETLSFKALEDLSGRCRRVFRELGLEPGDRVALIMCDCPEWIAAFLGAASMGAIAVPCSTMLAAAGIRSILADCGARIAIITQDQRDLVEAALAGQPPPQLEAVLIAGGGPGPNDRSKLSEPTENREALDAGGVKMLSLDAALKPAALNEQADEGNTREEHEVPGDLRDGRETRAVPGGARAGIAPEAPAFILYTSGSTGSPKGVVHSHADILNTMDKAGRGVYGITAEDRVFSSSRLFFAYGFGNSFSFPVGLGAASILCRERPKPELIAEIFARHRPTLFFGVPQVFRSLLEYRRQGNALDTRSLRLCASAGEALPARIFDEWRDETGVQILDALGSTELLHVFIANPVGRSVPGSSGTPVPGYEARLVDESGRDITGAGQGNLEVKGPSAFSSYWNQPERTAATLGGDGWVRTGDVYRRDEAGFYWHEGRSDDMFKHNGMWISPAEIEQVLGAQEPVLEAAVVAERDADGANLIAAHVVLRPGLVPSQELADRITAAAAGALPRHKRPERVYFLTELPRSATGKVQRFKLRQQIGT